MWRRKYNGIPMVLVTNLVDFAEILSFPLLGVATVRFLYKRASLCVEEAHSAAPFVEKESPR